LITLDELELDHLNPADVAKRLNKLVVMRNEHLLDPTEILRFKNLQQARLESIARTVFYGLQIVYGMFWYVAWPSIMPSAPAIRWKQRC
ncbi:hypothetical protein BBJ28_00023562, partial [Nothophytophthora sp. Chile5]